MLKDEKQKIADEYLGNIRVDFERFIIRKGIESHSNNRLETNLEDGRYRNPCIQTLFACWLDSHFLLLQRVEDNRITGIEKC